MIIILDISIVAIIFFFALSFGSEAAKMLSAFVLKYQIPIIFVLLLSILAMNVYFFKDTKKYRIPLISINTIIDLMLQVGFITVTFTYVQSFVYSMEKNFLLTVIFSIAALGEFLLVTGLSGLGSTGISYYVNKELKCLIENNKVRTVFFVILFKMIWIVVFLWVCREIILNHWSSCYFDVFNDTIFDKIYSIIPFSGK